VLDGETVAEAQVRAEAIAASASSLGASLRRSAVIAGQGTIALEMLEERPTSTCW
jgi:threonine dehydratase